MATEEVRKRILTVGVPKTKGRDLDDYLASANVDRSDLEAVTPFDDKTLVLDIGCGYGRLATAFADTPQGYVGVDVSFKRHLIACSTFAPYSNCLFAHIPMENARYNPGIIIDPSTFRVGLPDATFQAAACISLFTHMPYAEHVIYYLREIARLVSPGGALLTTWLTDTACPVTLSTAHRSVFSRAVIDDMLATTGWDTVSESGDGSIAKHLRLLSRRRA